jgi:methylmalonyl-CoA epimerase
LFKIKNLDHVGIAVLNMDEAISTFKTKFGMKVEKVVEIRTTGLKMGIIDSGNCFIELMEPVDKNTGTVAKFLERQGRNAIHHIAFAVDSDLEEVAAQLKQLFGVEMTNPHPTIGVMGHPVNFCHPKFTSDVLIEVCDPDYEKRRQEL